MIVYMILHSDLNPYRRENLS
jgi:hypothetical protein